MEKILKVEDCEDLNWNGYKITTDEQEIKILIENEQFCCEDWGYICSEDNLSDFIGAEIISIKTTDDALKTTELKLEDVGVSGRCFFVTIETTKGPLQFTLYNEHSGYYGHEVRIISKQIEEESCL